MTTLLYSSKFSDNFSFTAILSPEEYKMPGRETPSTGLWFEKLPSDIRQSSAIGAEVHFPSTMATLNVESLTEEDKDVLRRALFENQVIVIRKQKGVDPKTLPQLAKVFDPTASDIHSAGEKAVSDPRNILSAYKAGRIPRAPQVGIIGSGKFTNYEGLDDLEVIHLVWVKQLIFSVILYSIRSSNKLKDHTTFHEEPLSQQELDNGYTRPYRWHMDTPFYERLPGEVTILHAVKVPELPDQTLKFPDGKEKKIAAGATACMFVRISSSLCKLTNQHP